MLFFNVVVFRRKCFVIPFAGKKTWRVVEEGEEVNDNRQKAVLSYRGKTEEEEAGGRRIDEKRER